MRKESSAQDTYLRIKSRVDSRMNIRRIEYKKVALQLHATAIPNVVTFLSSLLFR